MAKKDYLLLIDTETTMDDKVVDFGALIVDRKGNIHTEAAILIADMYTDKVNHPLFYNEYSGELWRKASLELRYNKYDEMLNNGNRMLASVTAVNKWLSKVLGKYNPILTAYNLSFDTNKCYNTAINLDMFTNRFCLMKASQDKWMLTKNYRQFILDNHYFNNRTKLGNMSFTYKADVMAKFVLDNPSLEDEPHTAYEDARFYELPILLKLINTTKREKWMNPAGLSWQQAQVKDWFKVK